MRFWLALCSLSHLVHRAATQDDDYLNYGERIRCAKYFPADPCFWRATYLTSQCIKPYNWNIKTRDIDGTASNEDLALATMNDFLSLGHSDLIVNHGPLAKEYLNATHPPNTVLVDPNTTQDTDMGGVPKSLVALQASNPPCCQFSEACYNFMASLPPGTKVADKRENWEKWVCCLSSWALGCGSKVPDEPATIRAPPKCTMPKGHDPWADKQ